MTTGRLPPPYGRLLDRARTIPFEFEGARIEGLAGDTVASALWAAGTRVLARSFKYRRPRGLLGHGAFDATSYVQRGAEPNVAADRLLLVDGLPAIEGQNRIGSLTRDRGAWIGHLGRFLPVGFYYRTFFRPAGSWDRIEPAIRRRAGLGILGKDGHHAECEKVHLFCDVAVVGGGPAGIAAANAAAAAGAEVILFEAMARAGGFALVDPAAFPDALPADGVRVMTGAIAQGLFEDGMLAVELGDRHGRVRARCVVVATGAAEQPIVFRNNDLPGVMLASAARALIHLYAVRPGTRAAVVTVNDHGLAAALDLHAAGVEIAIVADARTATNILHERLAEAGVTVRLGTVPYEAVQSNGLAGLYYGGPVTGIELATKGAHGTARPEGALHVCDLVVMSGGWSPLAALACHAGARLAYDADADTFALSDIPGHVFAVGAAAGLHTPTLVVEDAREAGHAAADAALGRSVLARASPEPEPGFNHPWPIVPHPKGKEFLEFDEDLTIADIENAVADGFDHGELLKRYSTAGMGPSQGKQAALAVLRVAARARRLAPEGIGPTTSRPPFTAERIDLLAGRAFHPARATAMQLQHRAYGATTMVAGLWQRPAFYGAPADAERAIAAEVMAVHEATGMIDVSTLGKIELRGPDAAAFLDRIYATPHAKQPVGRGRYCLLLDEAGNIADDGVIGRLAETHFYVTATTGQADATYRLLTWLNAQWGMDVDITNLTGAFAALNIAGPASRTVLAGLVEDVDLAPGAFKYMDVRHGRVAGVAARLLRVGFVGELGYEIHMPAAYGQAVWTALADAGRAHGLRPFGVEAQRLLRLQKAHVIIGQDTDGLTTPAEANMGWAVGKTKTSFVGRAALAVRGTRPLQRVLVGFRMDASATVPPEASLVIEGDAIGGRVTSAARSAAAGGIIGLAFVPPSRAAEGSPFAIRLPSGAMVGAEVAPTPFYDPGNTRQER
ncbi:MAG: FAD-dependent oxidoreductase [Alphaproteobacteria bacterium]|nr:FAD-dependent oxidoreductase [Alphaproteobacteria bacterium]